MVTNVLAASRNRCSLVLGCGHGALPRIRRGKPFLVSEWNRRRGRVLGIIATLVVPKCAATIHTCLFPSELMPSFHRFRWTVRQSLLLST